MRPRCYICTVGTGTAGPHSDLAQGLVNAIRMAHCEYAFLVPTEHPDSQAVATLVREELDDPPVRIFSPLESPDDVLSCRKQMRAILKELADLEPEGRIVLNPTSGTKQMTTGAFLAGIDRQIDGIQYIVGPRSDGVVRTGAERLASVSGRRLFGEQRALSAKLLLDAGAYRAAFNLLADFQDLYPQSASLAETFSWWDRLAYRKAVQAAAKRTEASWKPIRQTLAMLAEASSPSLPRAADMLQCADRRLVQGQPEEALSLIYRTVESLAKLRLKELGIAPEAFTLETILQHPDLHPSPSVREQLQALDRQTRGPLPLGLRLCLELLRNTEFPLADHILGSNLNWSILQQRNSTRYGHGTDFVETDRVRHLHREVARFATDQWSTLPDLMEHCALPDITPILEEEIDHA